MTVNGMPATLYIPPSDDRSPDLIWEDSEKSVIFFITAHVSENDLIKMAENIVEKIIKNFSIRCPKSTGFVVTKGEHTKEGGESHEKGINPLGTVAAGDSLHNGAGKPRSFPFN